MRLHNLVIGHRGRPISSALSAELGAGDFVCLVGRNGSGKTTLLRTLAGLLPPVAGSVLPPANAGTVEAPAVVLTTVPELHNTSVSDLVAYGRLSQGGVFGRLRGADREAAHRAIQQVGIHPLADRLFHRLSDGEKQKAMIAMALAQGRATLLLDEPSAFLDYPSRCELMSLLQRIAHEDRKAVLLSTHDLELARGCADQLWLLRDGELHVFRTPTDFDVQAFGLAGA